MNTACFDLECSNLAADYGTLLCAVIKPLGCEPTIIRLPRSPATCKDLDRRLAIAIRNELAQYDVLVSWNGKRFDIPYLNARLFYHNLPPLDRVKHVDLMYTARYRMHLSNARLETVAMHLSTKARKTRLDPAYWIRAVGGDAKAMQYIVDHCIADVELLEECFEKLKSQIDCIWK